ncbi:MAG: hypothetical protein AAFU34_14285 [Pseudomonadota bacterium]
MFGLRKILQTLVAVSLMTTPAIAAPGWPNSPKDQVRFFATCAGWMAAQQDHDWLIDQVAATENKQYSEAFSSLIEAILPDIDGLDRRTVFKWRVHAKLAQTKLLERADYSRDSRSKVIASQTARANLTQCQSVLLG